MTTWSIWPATNGPAVATVLAGNYVAGMMWQVTSSAKWLYGYRAWCCNAGHGRREIVEAIQKQAAVLDFAPTFQMGHPLAFQAAARLADLDAARLRTAYQARQSETGTVYVEAGQRVS